MTEATARLDKKQQANLAAEITADQVRAWLQGNPDFFEQHPSCLNELQIPHAESGNAVSLIERQVKHLQQQNQELQQRLNMLVGVAHDNQRRLTQLQALQLRLIAAEDHPQLVMALTDSLKNDFDCDFVQVLLYGVSKEPAAANIDDLPAAFAEYKKKPQSQCGRLRQPQLDWLFQDNADSIRSAAVIPLGELGLLALGSKADQRFAPDQGTAFLDHLGQLCSLLLARHPQS